LDADKEFAFKATESGLITAAFNFLQDTFGMPPHARYA
jgi:hypothetical protein